MARRPQPGKAGATGLAPSAAQAARPKAGKAATHAADKAGGKVRRSPPPQTGFIVHGLAHVEAALAAAVAARTAVLLLSAPDAAATIGAGVFAAIIREGRAAVPGGRSLAVLDCGTAAGRALDAIDHRVDAIRVRLKPALRARIAALAGTAGVRVFEGRVQALDLRGHSDAHAACQNWLAGCQPGPGAIPTRPRAPHRKRARAPGTKRNLSK